MRNDNGHVLTDKKNADGSRSQRLGAINGITRRTALKIGGAAAILPVLARGAAAQTPNKGGHLIQGLAGGGTSDSLQPELSGNPYINNVCYQLRSSLIEIDENGNLEPAIVEKWEPAGSAASWILNIRQGVEFHNGKTLNADDVVYSVNIHRREGTKSGAAAVVRGIKEIKRISERQVRVDLTDENADLPYFLSSAITQLQVVPDETKDFSNGMGSGPFILESFEPGIRALTRRNRNFWRSDRGNVDSVETLAMSDINSRSTALITGELNLINQVDPSVALRMGSLSKVNVLRTPGWQYYHFTCRMDDARFADKNVRLALKYAIDRDRIMQSVINGMGLPGNDHPVSSTMKYYAQLDQHSYDPDYAKSLLKKSGYDSLTVPLHVAEGTFQGAVDAAQLYKESAKKAGITIDIVREPNDGYWSDVWLKKPFYASFARGRPTVDLLLSVFYKSNAVWNEGQFKRDDFDKLIIQGRVELDDAKRTEIYAECQRMLWQDGPSIVFAFADYIDAVSSNLKGFDLNPTGPTSGFRAPERVWFG